MLYDSKHIAYIAVSLAVTVLLLLMLARFKSQRAKNIALKITGILNGYVIGLLMLAAAFFFTALWEMFACPKGYRWYNRLARIKDNNI